MGQETQNQKYRGVRCFSCGQPIAISPSLVNRENAARTAHPNLHAEALLSLFNLRCRACSKENFYRVSEIVDIEGTPRLTSHGSHVSASLLRPSAGLSRVANG